MVRDSFILYTEQKEIFESLSDEQAGKLIKQIFDYINTGKEPEVEGMLKVAFIPIRQILDRNNNKWENTKKKRSEAGRRGANNRWNNKNDIKTANTKTAKNEIANAKVDENEIAKIANAKIVKNEIAKIAVNDNVNDNDNVNVNVNDNVNVNVNDNVNDNIINNNINNISEKASLYNEEAEKIQKVIIETLGTTNLNNIKECIDYLDKLPYELIEYALKKTARIERPCWQYTISILEGYITKKIKTVEEAKADDLKYKTKKVSSQDESEKEKQQRKIKELEEIMNANK